MAVGTTTRGVLFKIVTWAQREGEVKVLDRLLIFTLPALLKEKITGLTVITEGTEASPECCQVVREAAQKIVGKSCPH